ncbi:hypothetical protein C1645_812667 [Glomus cerebriforme]|uniref:Uncharacterized protein n=1 Tax=Glomus cerebriforme TaxID=658196 RepID=A0A397TTJ6_9GLOM|nr:hypothetical protein C1645_812667 [Glomus cerebriforme]
MLFLLTLQYNFARSDVVFNYYEDTDNFAFYFIRATPGVIYYCDNATDDILVSYTHDDKIVSIDISRVSRSLQCHMFDTKKTIDGKLPLTLNHIYYEDSDILKIYFTNYILLMSTLQNNSVKTDIEDIEVERDNMGRIVCILFYNAKNKIVKPISEEERKKLAKICEEEAEEFDKKQYEIVKKYL